MTLSEKRELLIRLQNKAEQIRQQFLPKGLEVADTAKYKFLEGGHKAVRKYAKSLT